MRYKTIFIPFSDIEDRAVNMTAVYLALKMYGKIDMEREGIEVWVEEEKADIWHEAIFTPEPNVEFLISALPKLREMKKSGFRNIRIEKNGGEITISMTWR